MRIVFFDDEIIWSNIKIIWSNIKIIWFFLNLKPFITFTLKCVEILRRVFGFRKRK